jgi:cellulose biosynthesis protein BcsQ
VVFAGQQRQTGKTTLALNLGVTLAQRGHRCLMVDLGEDADLTYGCGITPNEKFESGIDLVLFRRHWLMSVSG